MKDERRKQKATKSGIMLPEEQLSEHEESAPELANSDSVPGTQDDGAQLDQATILYEPTSVVETSNDVTPISIDQTT